MLAMIPHFGFLNELYIPPEHHLFGKAVKTRQTKHSGIVTGIHYTIFGKTVILAMLCDYRIEHACIF